MKNQQGFTLVELMVVVCLIGIVAALVVPIGLRFGTERYSEGARVGEVVKFGSKGIYCKTWEGELKLQEGGSSQTDNGRWKFTVEDLALVPLIQGALGKKAKLEYYEKGMVINPCKGDTFYRVEKVTVLN